VHDATTQTPETEKDQFASKNKLRSTSPKARRRHYTTRQGERMIAETLETVRETGGANKRRMTCTKHQGERMSAETLGTVSERRPGHGGEYKEAQKKW
jgi:hypothetical protein